MAATSAPPGRASVLISHILTQSQRTVPMTEAGNLRAANVSMPIHTIPDPPIAMPDTHSNVVDALKTTVSFKVMFGLEGKTLRNWS